MLGGCLAIAACSKGNVANRIISMERAALDRWGKGDVNGYLDLDDPDVTYSIPRWKNDWTGLPP